MIPKKAQARASHHGETAADYLVAGVPRARPEQTAGEVLAALSGRHYDCVDCLCLIDDEDRLVGVVPFAQLLAMPGEHRLQDEIRGHVPHVLPDVDQERVASVALHHGLSAVPVVDRSARLLGVVPSCALMQILRREHVEDIHRLAGVGRETHRAREAIESPPLRRARHRLPWLLVGLVGSMLATLVVAGFEDALAANVAVAFFIPGLVYLADAIGTQSEAVAVRGLSLSHAGLGQLIGGELRTGLLMGVTLAAVAPAARVAGVRQLASGGRGGACPGLRRRRCDQHWTLAALAPRPARHGSRLRQRTTGDHRSGSADPAHLLRDGPGDRRVSSPAAARSSQCPAGQRGRSGRMLRRSGADPHISSPDDPPNAGGWPGSPGVDLPPAQVSADGPHRRPATLHALRCANTNVAGLFAPLAGRLGCKPGARLAVVGGCAQTGVVVPQRERTPGEVHGTPVLPVTDAVPA